MFLIDFGFVMMLLYNVIAVIQ